MDNGDNKEENKFHQETSTEGLVLKKFPSHLKYAYLELPKSKPMIISARLSDTEEKRLLKILKNYQESIAWSIDELKVSVRQYACTKYCWRKMQNHLLNIKED